MMAKSKRSLKLTVFQVLGVFYLSIILSIQSLAFECRIGTKDDVRKSKKYSLLMERADEGWTACNVRRATLVAVINAKLSKLGIATTTDTDFTLPTFYVNLSIMQIKSGNCLYSLDVSVRNYCGGGSLVYSNSGTLGIGPKMGFGNQIQDAVIVNIDEAISSLLEN